MMNAQSRIFRSVVVIATALGFGAGCGGTVDEQLEPAQELDSVAQEAVAEEPRKFEDLIAGLDRDAAVLHTIDSEQDISLRQLQAVKIGENKYEMKDALTGDVTRFAVQVYPITVWPSLLKRCSNGQIVFSWQTCPTRIVTDPLTRVWKNSSCNWRVQAASTSACTNTSSGGSYRYQYLEAWKCGVGTGYCVERRAVRTIRYDYDLAACNPAIITGVTPTAYDFLCLR
ncbi:hypothetical protein [Hyalangium gracile]|uniref:hypothetical protein n=1 Tax=Hyalangium gracile TaxID=394092 RepID=UPI001CCA9DC2|nr:hypothetical protein [Hyalangium gracile]